MKTMTVTLKTVTPLFLGGADWEYKGEKWENKYNQRGPIGYVPSELRAPSIKGLLRYWYRALVGCYSPGSPVGEEDIFFGSTLTGQSPVHLQTKGDPLVTLWKKQAFRKFTVPRSNPPKNGIWYLGFSLDAKSDDLFKGKKVKVQKIRRQIEPNQSFTLVFRSKNEKASEIFWAALWILCHLGGLGFRSRRCFGSLGIENVQGFPYDLPLAGTVGTPEELLDSFEKGMHIIYKRLRLKWPCRDDVFPHFYQNQPVRVVGKAMSGDKITPWDNWQDAISDMGLRLMEGRTGFKLGCRKAFGLPITTKGSSDDRHGSPLWIRLQQLSTNKICALVTTFPANKIAVPSDPVAQFLNNLPYSLEKTL